MNYFYFTRHGETIWNVENKICGKTDISLTDLGHIQAEKIGQYIASKNIKIDEIICSPLVRAYDTAKHISEETGIPFRIEHRLKEQDFGIYEGTARDGKEFHEAKKQFIYSFGNGESMLKFAHRIYSVLDDIQRDNKIYLIVAHNGLTRILMSYFNDMSHEEFSSIGIDNCELLKLNYDSKEIISIKKVLNEN